MNHEWAGRLAALNKLGLKEASLRQIAMRQRPDPFTEISRRLSRTFQVKMPKFDTSAQLQRLMGNPFKQPAALLSGKLQPLRV